MNHIPFSNSHNGHSARRPQIDVACEHRTPDPSRPVAIELTIRAPAANTPDRPMRPLNLGLAIDRSGSMSGEKLRAARDAALRVVEALADGDRVAIAAFDSLIVDICPSTLLDEHARARLVPRIRSLTPGSTTALFDGFLRASELVADGGAPTDYDSRVIVLSDGMGNVGLTHPPRMQEHAANLARLGICTSTVGIGADYKAGQLAALSSGGRGEFHHASDPVEISEVLLGELKELRSATLRSLEVAVEVEGLENWQLLGGWANQIGARGTTHFSRVAPGSAARVVILGWPMLFPPRIAAVINWLDENSKPASLGIRLDHDAAPVSRDLTLAGRAARLWQAQISAQALELNERRRYEEAVECINGFLPRFRPYVAELPEAGELLGELDMLRARVHQEWDSIGQKEAIVYYQGALQAKEDLRVNAPETLREVMQKDQQA